LIGNISSSFFRRLSSITSGFSSKKILTIKEMKGFLTYKSSAASLAFLRRVSPVFLASSNFSPAAALAFSATF
jgi:hypothetical protein